MLERTAWMLCSTKVHWPTFKTKIQDITGKNPLHANRESLDDPAAYVNLINNGAGLDVLGKQTSGPLRHFFLAFIVHALPATVQKLHEITSLSMTARYGNDERAAFVMSGTLDAWKHVVIYTCQEHHDQALRWIGNQIYFYLANTRLITLFKGYSKLELDDETFYLRPEPRTIKKVRKVSRRTSKRT